jgi:predicted nucleic acid-binding protein
MGKSKRLSDVQAVVDTTILVDLWRANTAALNWMATQRTTVFGLPVLVYMEVVNGARNRIEVQQAITLLQPYPVIYLISKDSKWAQEQHLKFKLSHNVGIGDALIASASARLKIPIYTLNTKHFAPLPDVTAIRPY